MSSQSAALVPATEEIVTILRSGGSYTATVSSTGKEYAVQDFVTVSGSSLGGSTPANDAIITVTRVDSSGDITGASVSGIAITSYKVSLTTAVWASNPQPTAGPVNTIAAPTVTISGTSYSVAFVSGYPGGSDDGRGYGSGSGHTGGPFSFKIPGTYLGGTSPANDLTFTCASAGAGVGQLQGIGNIVGTAATYTATIPNNNYKFRKSQIRDAGDWITQKRQIREYQTYKPSSVINKSTEDPWIQYGTGFRLSFLNGEYKLRVANGNGFNTTA